MIARRFILERDEPADFPGAIRIILLRYNLSQAAWILNVPRETLRSWLNGSKPNYDDGRAVLKLAEHCRNITTQEIAAA